MRTDSFGQTILTEGDLCELYMVNPQRKFFHVLVDGAVKLDSRVELNHAPRIVEYLDSIETQEQFDSRLQSNWNMPPEYKELDIAQWVLEQCETDVQRQRVGEELLLYIDRDLFPLLQYLKYLVDTMRANNIVWGVGRGSSVASYVLFLIGIHRIDSIYYDLDIKDFLR
jgi:hypothetical protein